MTLGELRERQRATAAVTRQARTPAAIESRTVRKLSGLRPLMR